MGGAPEGGFDAQLSALESGAGRLGTESGTLDGLGGQASGATGHTAGGVLGGPLAGALQAFGTEMATRTGNLSRALTAASQSVRNCATTYQQQDAAAQSALMSSMAQAGQGAPMTGALMTNLLAPQAPKPADDLGGLLLPGFEPTGPG